MSVLLPLVLSVLLPQEPAPVPPKAQEPPTAEQLIARYRALPEEKRGEVWRQVERKIQREQDAFVVRIFGHQRGLASYPVLSPPAWHKAEEFAAGVAPVRRVVAADTDQYAKVRKQLPRPLFLDDLQAAVVYDWQVGKAARTATPLDDDAAFANAAHGFLPGADHAVAQILEILDDDPKQRQIAAYLEHAYADLDAAVYPGITLYDSWYSGKVLDVPDVDAIPFARTFVKGSTFRSPIPANSRRDKLYQQIRDATFEHRKYRTLRLAAAAAYVCAVPSFDPVYLPLVDRFHYAWASVQDEPKALKALLQQAKDRQGLLEGLDEKVKKEPAAFELREGHKAALKQVGVWLRELCAEALAKAQD